MISGKMKKALKSDNRFVSLQSIQLLMRIVHTNIAIMDMKVDFVTTYHVAHFHLF